MPVEIIPSFLFYCFVSGITPGPANLCSLSLALRRGRSEALKQWVGIFVGYAVVSLVSGGLAYFVGNALNEYVKALSFVGAAYILWLAFHVLREKYDSEELSTEQSSGLREGGEFAEKTATEVPVARVAAPQKSRWQHFFTGLFVQLTNVKIMVFCVTAQTSFLLPYNRSFGAVLLLALFLPFTGPVCNMVWLLTGAALQRFFVRYQRTLNVVMALSLVLCAVSIVLN